jgi:hypothetical protein
MAKKKVKKAVKTEKKKSRGLLLKILEFPFLLLQFIIMLPFRAISFIFSMSKKVKEKNQVKKIQKRRESMEATYQDFQIIESISGDIKAWEKSLPKSSIGIIIGARGKGKSALGVKILENIRTQTKKSICAMGFNQDDMPAWINVVEDVKEIPSGSFVLIDEGGILFSSRRSMTDANQMLSDLILISRHKGLSILFISQNSSNLDINILRQADYLLLKPSSLLQIDFERKKVKEIYDEMKDKFEQYKDNRGLTYIYSEDFRGFVNNPLPSFWSKDISTSFK